MKNRKSTMYGTVAFLLTVSAFLVCWKFIVPDYQKNQEEIAQVEEEIKQAKTKLESLKVTQKSLEEIGTLADDLLVAVPGDVDAPNLITELEALTAKHNTIIPSIQISNSSSFTSGGSSNAVDVSFSVSGSFADMNSIVTSLEKDIRFMNIQSLSLSAGGEEAGASGAMSLSVELTAYKRIDTSLTSQISDLSGIPKSFINK